MAYKSCQGVETIEMLISVVAGKSLRRSRRLLHNLQNVDSRGAIVVAGRGVGCEDAFEILTRLQFVSVRAHYLPKVATYRCRCVEEMGTSSLDRVVSVIGQMNARFEFLHSSKTNEKLALTRPCIRLCSDSPSTQPRLSPSIRLIRGRETSLCATV